MTFGMPRLGRSIRLAARSLVAGLLLAMLCGSAQPVMPVAPKGEQPVSYHEVRLRKLHLVRPDLIPYPVCYEVYC